MKVPRTVTAALMYVFAASRSRLRYSIESSFPTTNSMICLVNWIPLLLSALLRFRVGSCNVPVKWLKPNIDVHLHQNWWGLYPQRNSP